MRTFIVCTILVFCFLAIGCKGLAYRASTDSMRPTITIDDMCITDQFAYSSKPIERFDMVVFQSPEEIKKRFNQAGDVRYIKRVIGLPNEKLEIKNNQIFINDKLLDEPFEKITSEKITYKKDFSSIVIPNDEYFLLGDNRPESEDSRYWKKATINKKDIYSKIVEIKKDYYKNK
jgi:signal peptidase I